MAKRDLPPGWTIEQWRAVHHVPASALENAPRRLLVEGFGRVVDGTARYPTPEVANAGVEAMLVELQKDIPELRILSLQYE